MKRWIEILAKRYTEWRAKAWRKKHYIGGSFAFVSRDGAGNRVMTSPNGITWTARTSAADNNVPPLFYSPELQLVGNQQCDESPGWVPICWVPEYDAPMPEKFKNA